MPGVDKQLTVPRPLKSSLSPFRFPRWADTFDTNDPGGQMALGPFWVAGWSDDHQGLTIFLNSADRIRENLPFTKS